MATPDTPLEDAVEEASQEGAFNEETGEINWDCPCLGGMAHGPCGEQFKAAFSCFVFSKEDPKGMDCIEHFKTMQTCFRDHPDIYGGELEDEEESDESVASPPEGQPKTAVAAPLVASTGRPSASLSEGHPDPAVATPVVAAVEKSSASTEAAYNPSSDPGPSASAAAPSVASDSSSADDTSNRAQRASEQVKREHSELTSESDETVPKAAHDAR